MAASTAKKPTAYREGRADKTKKPSIEIEIKPEGEEEEGSEGEEMDAAKSHSRKRSAKGAKNTKPAMDGGMYGKKPMDGDCGCMGKGRKGKCDGSCGKKMDRNDALTPQEYLAACELGIQGRSRAYIRARLDSAARLDLKCGKGSISEGEKCTKGTAQKVSRRKAEESIRAQVGAEAKSGALSGALAGAFSGVLKSSLSGLGTGALAGNALKGALSGAAFGGALGAAGGLGGALGNRAGNALARRVTRKPGRRDSVYAAGFSTELDQLAI